MKRYAIAVFLSSFLIFAPGVKAADLAGEFASLPCTPSTNANLIATGGMTGYSLSLGTNSVMAGAITSLKINGSETVNTSDHGREIQYAFQIGSGGEGNNPTEAGGSGGYSSKFIEGCASGNTIYTKSQMAYWLPYNGQTISPYILSKIVTIGANGIPNLIHFVARIHAPVTSDTLYVEAPTGYHNASFTGISTFTPGPNTLQLVPPTSYVHNLYNVFDNAYSTGPNQLLVVANDRNSFVPYMPGSASGYFWGLSVAGSTSKWSMGAQIPNPQPGDYYIESYLLVSPNQSVASDIVHLLSAIPLSTSPIGFLDSATCSAASGWAGDSDSKNTSIDVHFYADGATGAGGTFIGAVTANSTREAAVCAAIGSTQSPCPHGFVFTTPASLKDGKPHTIYAYGINAPGSGGVNALLAGSPRTITCFRGDLDGDGHVNINDFNLLKSHFGNPYTIFDYNDLVTNFGK